MPVSKLNYAKLSLQMYIPICYFEIDLTEYRCISSIYIYIEFESQLSIVLTV